MILSHDRIAEIDHQHFDFIIFGGGINGIAIQKEASSRGYKTLLIDKHDFLSGATSHSSRLIHGGLRYLEYFELELVYESLKARQYLLDHFSHIVKPLNLHIPILKKRGRPRWMIKCGLLLYDLLSFKKKLPNHNPLPPSDFLNKFTKFNKTELKYSYSYFDAQIEWPERLCLQLLSSISNSSFALNYIQTIAYKKTVTHSFVLSSLVNRKKVHVSADLIINASGPWVDKTNAELGETTTEMGGTKGSHIVINEQLTPFNQGIYVEAKQDGRPFFILPWIGKTLIGTTDIFFNDSLDHVAINQSEFSYLKKELQLLFPQTNFDSIQYTFSGIRPLPKVSKDKKTAKITRMHSFNWIGKNKQIIDVIGGKLTTFPELSLDLLRLIDKKFNQTTHTLSFFLKNKNFIPNESDLKRELHDLFLQQQIHLSENDANRLISFYGSELNNYIKTSKTLKSEDFSRLCGEIPQFIVEMKYIMENETVVSWSDFFERRTDISVLLGQDKNKWNSVFDALKSHNFQIDHLGQSSNDYLDDFFVRRFGGLEN